MGQCCNGDVTWPRLKRTACFDSCLKRDVASCLPVRKCCGSSAVATSANIRIYLWGRHGGTDIRGQKSRKTRQSYLVRVPPFWERKPQKELFTGSVPTLLMNEPPSVLDAECSHMQPYKRRKKQTSTASVGWMCWGTEESADCDPWPSGLSRVLKRYIIYYAYETWWPLVCTG